MNAEKSALELYQPMQSDVMLHRPPAKVLAEAREAAVALKDVVDHKSKPVKFNGEVYLEFEDLQTLARFYGITAKVRSTQFVQFDKVSGWEASAEAILVSGGQIISAADAMCLNDEQNWKAKPMFQLRSMAQTRACAKALRNVLAWVVVLAGYKPTPAEEMDGVFQKHEPKPKEYHDLIPPDEPILPPPADAPPAQESKPVISDAQRKRAYAIARNSGMTDVQFREFVESMGYKSSKDILKADYEDICTALQNWKP